MGRKPSSDETPTLAAGSTALLIALLSIDVSALLWRAKQCVQDEEGAHAQFDAIKGLFGGRQERLAERFATVSALNYAVEQRQRTVSAACGAEAEVMLQQSLDRLIAATNAKLQPGRVAAAPAARPARPLKRGVTFHKSIAGALEQLWAAQDAQPSPTGVRTFVTAAQSMFSLIKYTKLQFARCGHRAQASHGMVPTGT